MDMTRKGKYYVVLDFMVFDLKLKGLQKDIYAIIYGFCQAGNSYTGSLKYLADWTQSTKQGVTKALAELQEKGLIDRKETYINNVKFVEYYTTQFNGVYNSVNEGYTTQFNGGIQLSCTNNINIKNTKNDNTEDNIDAFVNEFTFSTATKENLIEAINGFKEMRKKIKKPLTDTALKLIFKKLKTYSNCNGETAIEILENSILNSWQGIFKLKEDDSRKQGKAPAVNNSSEYPF